MAGAAYAEGRDALAICDRCRQRFAYLELRADGDQPGLRVCSGCWDMLDPWKLPPRQPEAIALRHPRPDEPLTAGNVSFVGTVAAGSSASRIIAVAIAPVPVEAQLREMVLRFDGDTITVALRGVETTIWNNHSEAIDVIALPATPAPGDTFRITDTGAI